MKLHLAHSTSSWLLTLGTILIIASSQTIKADQESKLRSREAVFSSAAHLFEQLESSKGNKKSATEAVQFLRQAKSVTNGNGFACALIKDGTVWCWGRNASGELGNGSTEPSFLPVQVQNLSKVIEISAGNAHACAITESHEAYCWGNNKEGQLGAGLDDEYSSTPVKVINTEEGVASLSAGGLHTCAALNDGSSSCWGHNEQGQLGDDTNISSNTPVNVVDLQGKATSVSASKDSSCVTLESGIIRCWGSNFDGQLGIGQEDGEAHAKPATVVGVRNASAVFSSATSQTFCVTTANADAWCWGAGITGQLANGYQSPANSPVPVKVLIKGHVRELALSAGHTCARMDDRVMCWGQNTHGQQGNGNNETIILNPTKMLGLGAKPVSLSASSLSDLISKGAANTCVVIADGRVKCTGSNLRGQLGIGTNHWNEPDPSQIPGLRGQSSLGQGYQFGCSLGKQGSVKCWGDDSYGQLGQGTFSKPSFNPVAVKGLNNNIKALATGYTHACVLTRQGGVKCWGGNDYGQLGNGQWSAASKPVDVEGLTKGVVSISAGMSHTCAVTNQSAVKCWGNNEFGQLGYPGPTSATPVQVMGLESGALSVGLGRDTSCAIVSSGIKCWGDNFWGQLGANYPGNDTDEPQQVVGIGPGAKIVNGGFGHTCAVSASGQALCWGLNIVGQLGNGTRDDCESLKECPRHPVPENVIGLSSPMDGITAGGAHTCGWSMQGQLQCWGGNGAGQLGDGGEISSPTPITVKGLGPVVTATAGDASTCSAMKDGEAFCWGENTWGQLGLGWANYVFKPEFVQK